MASYGGNTRFEFREGTPVNSSAYIG